MTISEYLINILFVLVVARQMRERRLDLRSVLVPVVLMVFVASQYLHTFPTTGNDLTLTLGLAAAGLMLGVLSGFATRLRVASDGSAWVRVGALAALLLVAGIGARMGFAFAVEHGAGSAVRSFSIANDITAAAWPVALVMMALCEVGARLATVQLRSRRLLAGHRASGSIVCLP